MAGEMYGVYQGTVVNAADPTGTGRVQVQVPALFAAATVWASICRPFGAVAGSARAGAKVVVAFEAGDRDSPIVLGEIR